MRIVKYGLALLFISCCIICFCSNSCRQASAAVDAKDSLIVINIDSLLDGPVPPLDSIYSGYKYIVDKYGSHFNDSPAFGNVIETSSNNFLIFDMTSVRVALYDSTGNFIRYIGSSGYNYNKGEYSSDLLRGAADNKYIYVFDDAHSIIQKYNYNGKYLGHIRVFSIDTISFPKKKNLFGGVVCDGIIPINNYRLLLHYAYWSGNIPYNYTITDNDGNVVSSIKTMGEYDGTSNGCLTEESHYYYNKTLYIKDLSDTVYAVLNDRFIPKYVFKQNNSFKHLTDSLGRKIDLFKVKNNPLRVRSIQEIGRYIFFSIYKFPPLSRITYCCYDKHSHTAYKMFDDDHIPAEKLKTQRDTSDFIYANCLVCPTNNNSVIGWGKKGRVRLYVKH